MENKMVSNTIQHFVDETNRMRTGNECVVVIIENPNVGGRTDRTDCTNHLVQEVDKHYHVAMEIEADLRGKILPPSARTMTTMSENMDIEVEACNQMLSSDNGAEYSNMIAFMDDYSEREAFSDLFAYYLFVIQWLGEGTYDAVVRGFNLGDYIESRLEGHTNW